MKCGDTFYPAFMWEKLKHLASHHFTASHTPEDLSRSFVLALNSLHCVIKWLNVFYICLPQSAA